MKRKRGKGEEKKTGKRQDNLIKKGTKNANIYLMVSTFVLNY